MSLSRISNSEFIRNDQDLLNKIDQITESKIQDGGEGAFLVFLN